MMKNMAIQNIQNIPHGPWWLKWWLVTNTNRLEQQMAEGLIYLPKSTNGANMFPSICLSTYMYTYPPEV